MEWLRVDFVFIWEGLMEENGVISLNWLGRCFTGTGIPAFTREKSSQITQLLITLNWRSHEFCHSSWWNRCLFHYKFRLSGRQRRSSGILEVASHSLPETGGHRYQCLFDSGVAEQERTSVQCRWTRDDWPENDLRSRAFGRTIASQII